jgi:hypothetical protein
MANWRVIFVWTVVCLLSSGCEKRIRPPGSGPGVKCASGINVSEGTWHPATQLDSGNGGYGSAFYSPEGVLYAFYSISTVPDQMKLKKRVTGQSEFSSQINVAPNARTAELFIDSTGALYASLENIGTALVYKSTDGGTSWEWQVSLQAKDFTADYAYHRAYLLEENGALSLYFGYRYHNAVFGDVNQFWKARQTAGSWPSSPEAVLPVSAVNGAQGAFTDGNGTVLALGTKAFRSTDSGASFTQVQNSGDLASDLTMLSGAAQNPYDGKVFAANVYAYGAGSMSHSALWQTSDFGAQFTKLTTVDASLIFRAKVAAAQNLVAMAWTEASAAAENEVWVTLSYDSGATWSAASKIVDFSGTSKTIQELSLAASCGGTLSLVYSLEESGVRKGAFLTELY